MRTNYVLVDFENVQPSTLEPLKHEHFRLFVFVGANQAKLSFEVADSLQRLGTRAEYVKISGNGANSLDFHIAYYIGKLAAEDPAALFHIVSKDTGFDPLIQHLRAKNLLVRRVKTIAEILVNKELQGKSPRERIDVVQALLKRMKTAKPRTIKTLSGTIVALFRNQVSEAEAETMIDALAERGVLSIKNSTILYALSCNDDDMFLTRSEDAE